MTVYSYPPTPSVIADGFAFVLDDPGPNSLIVGKGAFLIGGAVAAVALLDGPWTVKIDGLISGRLGALVVTGVSNIKIGATGTVSGGSSGVDLRTTGTITNAGVIEGAGAFSYGIQFLNDQKHTVINSGIISNNGDFNLGWAGIYSNNNSKDIIKNSGTISSLRLSGGDDQVFNFQKVGQKIVYGHIQLSDLGAGQDSYQGSKYAEDVTDGAGGDHVSLGGGNDTARQNTFNDGIDKIDGGTGVDSYSASAITTALRINIDSVKHSVPVFGFAAVAANTVTGTSPGDQKDKVSHFENAAGGSGGDLIYGTNGANKLEGNDGEDILCGLGGNDTLDGGGALDRLFGGLGKDILTGGADGDRFVYTSIKESGVTAATRDIITDFGDFDMIELSSIDAISTNGRGTNDEFTYIGTNVDFTGAPGDLRAVFTANGQRIEADVNGDRRPDFSIELKGLSHDFDISGSLFP